MRFFVVLKTRCEADMDQANTEFRYRLHSSALSSVPLVIHLEVLHVSTSLWMPPVTPAYAYSLYPSSTPKTCLEFSSMDAADKEAVPNGMMAEASPDR